MKLHHTITVHSIPALWTVVLMLINTNTVLMKRHAKYLAGFCVYYGFVNYFAVFNLRDGKPLYSFITWRDYKTYFYCFALILVSLMVFSVSAAIE